MAVALSSSLISVTDLQFRSIPGCSLKPSEQQFVFNDVSRTLSLRSVHHRRLNRITDSRGLSIKAGYSESGRPSSSSVFIGGFILGGIIVGTLGAVYAPQISRALAGTDKKDLMRKLPKFIYDEEKALERTRKILTEKIAQLNSAIDDVSSQLRADDAPNGAAVASDEVETAI